MIEQCLSRYRILRQIGSGGMGVVYLAHDERLQCDVALKVLPAGTIADDTARRRFRQEALAIAKRAHPNLVVVRDFDTQDGVDFLVMEYVEGQSLDEMLKKGILPEDQILELGAQLARGLSAAHRAGVIHRDIKPSNIKITPDGVVKILDFGLAKVRAVAEANPETVDEGSITRTGHIIGTVPYLAPEVILGSPADERSDVYSAGVVLYEMATGRKPHPGSNVSEVVQGIIGSTPSPPLRWNPGLSPSLDALILKSMHKEPARRHASAAELEADLRRVSDTSRGGSAHAWMKSRWIVVAIACAVLSIAAAFRYLPGLMTGVGSRTAVASLAVLPLRTASGDTAQDYFADGMTDELITTLSGINGISVISRTSAMAFKGSNKPVREIARELGVHWIVEGSVVRVDSLVRINASLVDAKRDRSLWARRYEGTLDDVLSLQASMAQAISMDVNVALSPSEKERLEDRSSVKAEALEAYLRGHYYWNRREEPDLQRAIAYFEKAIELDPGFAKPHAGLADVYAFLGRYSLIDQHVAYQQAKASALRALELEPNLGEAHASVGEMKLEYEWDWPGAEQEFQRAIELNPGYATARQWYAEYLARMGRHREAEVQITRALELDPLSEPIRGVMGRIYYYGRNYDRAIEHYRAALESAPDHVLTRFYLGMALLAKGQVDDAVPQLERADLASGGVPLTRAGLGYGYAAAGRRDDAVRIYDELERSSAEAPVSPIFLALVSMGLGDRDAVFRHMEEGFARRDSYLGHLKVTPIADPIRDDPRFVDLLRRLKLV
ncbi:MAG TPA: protein kinase [Candidatus Eisenbacteria bacterium]|nr:protein kinase [Candidatus Eisenbacteria bacterium]